MSADEPVCGAPKVGKRSVESGPYTLRRNYAQVRSRHRRSRTVGRHHPRRSGYRCRGTCPERDLSGTSDAPGGGLIWKGKTFRNGTVTNNFVFGLSGLSGNYYEDAAGRTVIDYGPSGLGFLTDTMVANGDGSYTGATYINGNQVGGFRLAR